MIKMAIMAINSKTLLKIFLFRTKRHLTFKHGMKHGPMELYKVSRDDLGLFYSKVILGCPCIFMGKISKII